MSNVLEQIKNLMGAGRTRTGRIYGPPTVSRKTRKQRSNKGVKRGPRTGKTRSGRRYRGVLEVSNNRAMRSVMRPESPRVRKQRSNKGKKRKPYGKRTGKTRSGRKFRV
jgi:hypothetical protein